GNDLQECGEDGTWSTIETCQYGCENNQCNIAPPTGIDWSLLMMGGLTVIVIAIVVVLIIFGFRKRKRFKAPRPMPEMKMRPDLP
ncbi:MAG: hypothetical protein JSV39_02145, partial [Candidatus Aenigmatarchaeota archaeon]